ncbi:cbb3-type cytochrome c oxidase subunit 3 [Dokdonella sp.]|uniref:cbb3-type cytochrome oxidase subunit 3 n=1 Tax=Dokdonella sp. TaxID=2291710 RepID=UPI001B1F22FD|nr:cbb3-type cytochrome c oxidase subunit 3 [Dokdonella sp.]MBO9663012.1 cbb3-type cytochrome c oxidase subunit 3 [Dokdonella sp.]
MNALWGHLTGVLIVLMMASFVGIWIWVWNGRHKSKFDALARLPMEDEPIESEPRKNGRTRR